MNFKKAIIIACKAKPNYVLWIQFDDGIQGDVDLSDLVGKGVFKAWESKKFFESVAIDPESKTVCWEGEIDLDPYVLKEDILKSKKRKSPPTKRRRATSPRKRTGKRPQGRKVS